MISVIIEHTKFTPARALALESFQKKWYDKCDQQNMKNAKKLLINSLENKLQKQMFETCWEDNSFIDHWMELMLLVQPISMQQCERVKKQLKNRSIKSYVGENFEDNFKPTLHNPLWKLNTWQLPAF